MDSRRIVFNLPGQLTVPGPEYTYHQLPQIMNQERNKHHMQQDIHGAALRHQIFTAAKRAIEKKGYGLVSKSRGHFAFAGSS